MQESVKFMSSKNEEFVLKIIKQHWVNGSKHREEDPCSHGEVLFKIKGIEVINESDGQWGLMNAAITLLRSIFNKEISEVVFLCGCCEYYPQASCPIRVNCKTIRKDNRVIISNIRKFPVTSEKIFLEYVGLSVEIEFQKYCEEIYKFTKEVREFNKKESIDTELVQFKENFLLYWQEFDKLFFQLEEMVKHKVC